MLDADTGEFYFLEVNTRLQVEHGVTEEVTGVDLIEWMVRLAAGELPISTTLAAAPRGAAIEARALRRGSAARLPAERRPAHRGRRSPTDVRVETWVEPGTEVTPFYDPMLAKIIARGDDREQARRAPARGARQRRASRASRPTCAYLRAGARREPAFRAGARDTPACSTSSPTRPPRIEVLEPGTQTTVQDYPGRLGYWDVGVRPPGPMDALSFGSPTGWSATRRRRGARVHAVGPDAAVRRATP